MLETAFAVSDHSQKSDILDEMNTAQKVLLALLKDFSAVHTATSLAQQLKMSRWGVWKIIKKLRQEEIILIKPTGKGKTSTQTIQLNWDNMLTEKMIILALVQEASTHKRWSFTFTDLEKEVDFLILYGSILHSQKEAKDIDVLGAVSKEKKLAKIPDLILKIQETQAKKIHSLNFTLKEFKQELKKPNKAYLDAVKKGVVLFGQENFLKFIKRLQKLPKKV